MPLQTQARLLRVLEYGEFIRVGSSTTKKTVVRVVTATNINLQDAVEKGKFREDLYYRLSTVPIYVPTLRERGKDIELLFRKFAIDFAEKYRVKPIQLTDGAKELLVNYRFPGNIRQLKNLVEQISVIEIDRTVDEDLLKKYLPQERSVPILYNDEKVKAEGISERDLLYRVLFDLKKDVTELKKHFLHAMKDGKVDSGILEQHPELFKDADSQSEEVSIQQDPIRLDQNQDTKTIEIDLDTGEGKDIQDIPHTTEEDESLSIEKKEVELIIKALRKNNNKRKYAAQDLGISERTLYRKIKQYEIENN